MRKQGEERCSDSPVARVSVFAAKLAAGLTEQSQWPHYKTGRRVGRALQLMMDGEIRPVERAALVRRVDLHRDPRDPASRVRIPPVSVFQPFGRSVRAAHATKDRSSPALLHGF